MAKNTKGPLIGIIVVALIVAGGVYWYYQNEEVVQPDVTTVADEGGPVAATLAYQQDGVEADVSGSGWSAAETDMVLHDGDSIKTGTEETSRAIIMLENGHIIRLGYGTEVQLTNLQSDSVNLLQASGASYSRVAKGEGTYTVTLEGVTVEALGTAFDVVKGDGDINVNVVESSVKVMTEDEEHTVVEGDAATIDTETKDVSVEKIDEETLTNEWFTWNKEEDTKTTDDLGALEPYAGPALTITAPENKTETTEGTVTIQGTVGDTATKVLVNDTEVLVSEGNFSADIALTEGKNLISVVAESSEGYRTMKEVVVTFTAEADVEVEEETAPTETPLTLNAETKTDGVYLSWNASVSESFLYYKVVRSETNADLTYPDDGYIAKLDKGTEYYTDTDVSADSTYYYRVCEVMEGDAVFCSNVAHMKGKVVEDEPAEEEPEEETPVSTTGLTLSATVQDNGIALSWTVTDVEIDKGFKLVKSESANPVYPGNDFKYLTDNSVRSYTWALTDGKTYHFRVCKYNGEGECLVYSNDVTATAPAPTETPVSMTLSAKAEDTGVGLWWTDASTIAGFKYYKVVRSETNADLKYPDDGHIAAKSASELSHRDYSSVSGKSYYYRICAVGDSVSCSNVVQVTAVNNNTAPTAVTLSGAYGEAGVTLSWTASDEADFKYFKVVWSQTNSKPVYPTDGYIAVVSSKAAGSHVDDGSAAGSRKEAVDLSSGTYYYSVCVVDQANQVACSNTVTVTDGSI